MTASGRETQRRRGVRASRAKLTRALTDAGLRTQAALAERIADLEGLDSAPKDMVSRAFRELPVEPQTLERVARALEVEAWTLYRSTDEEALPEARAGSDARSAPRPAWLALSGRVFAGVEDATVTEWRDRVTGALRSARKSLPGNTGHCQKLRTGIAGLELEAEQIELALSWRTLMTNNPEHADMQGRDTLIITNLVAAAPISPVDEGVRPLLNTLASALAHFPKGDHQP